MVEKTDNFGLTKLNPGDEVTSDNFSFLGFNIERLDEILAAAINHTHTGAAGIADPISAPDLVLDSTSGNLPAGTEIYYRYTYVDQYGAETAGSPSASVITPSSVIPPGSPGASSVTTGGTLSGGLYYYALTAYTNTDTEETQLGGRISISVPFTTATNTITLTLPIAPAGASGFNVYRRAPGGAEYVWLDSFTFGATPPTTYVDDGSITPVSSRRPPNRNLTASASNVTITLPGATPAVPAGVTWRLYRTYTTGNWSTSDLHHVVEETFTGSGIISPSYNDIGLGTGLDAIPEATQVFNQPNPIGSDELEEAAAFPNYSTAARPAANSVAVGTSIFNTTTGIPNWSNGTIWIDAVGNAG